jgi:hypothetical protein
MRCRRLSPVSPNISRFIARRTLLQSITVRPVLDDAGAETGMFEIPAGGRRYRALELQVRQKRLAKTAPIPCVVRTEGMLTEGAVRASDKRAQYAGEDYVAAGGAVMRDLFQLDDGGWPLTLSIDWDVNHLSVTDFGWDCPGISSPATHEHLLAMKIKPKGLCPRMSPILVGTH